MTCMLATPEGLLFTGSAAGGVDVWRLSSLAHLTVIPPPASAGMIGKMFRVRVLAAFTWGADDCDGVVANCYCCCTDPVDCLALSPCNNFLLCGFANGDLSFQTNEVQIAAQLKQALNDLGIGEGGIGAL